MRAIGPENQMHARTLVFGLSKLPLDIDPYFYILVKRVPMFRRFLVKFPDKADVVS